MLKTGYGNYTLGPMLPMLNIFVHCTVATLCEAKNTVRLALIASRNEKNNPNWGLHSSERLPERRCWAPHLGAILQAVLLPLLRAPLVDHCWPLVDPFGRPLLWTSVAAWTAVDASDTHGLPMPMSKMPQLLAECRWQYWMRMN